MNDAGQQAEAARYSGEAAGYSGEAAGYSGEAAGYSGEASGAGGDTATLAQSPASQMNRPRTGSLRGRLLVVLAASLLVIALGVGAGVTLFVAANEQQAWQGRQREAARYAGERVSTFLGRVQDSLRLVALMDGAMLGARPGVMDDVLKEVPALHEVIRLDHRGHVIASASSGRAVLANLFTIPQSTWFLEAKAGRPYLGGVQISTNEEPYLILAVPTPDGGAVAGRLSMGVLWDVVGAIGFGKTGQAYVVNQEGQVIAHKDPEVALSRASLEGQPEMADLFQAVSQTPSEEWSGVYQNLEGNQVVAVTAPVAGTGWVVISELFRSEALATSRAALLIVGGGVLAFGLLVALVSNRFLRQLIVRPMEQLSVGVQRLGRGDLSHRIEIGAGGYASEVGQLADSFNDMAGELQDLYEELTVRNRELGRRARYLEATNAIARDTVSELDLQELLSRVVILISQQFGFYHAGLFLTDPANEWAVLQAASSQGGQRMLARGHRLKLGIGIVGYVVQRGEPRVALDVGQDAVFFDNPDLPETRSEMALPLRARGEIIGALDVQSTEPGAFSQEDVAVLQTLADQVALAISNARLFQEAQHSLEAERRAYGQLSREAWQELLRLRSDLATLRDGDGLRLISEPDLDREDGRHPFQDLSGPTVRSSDGSCTVPIQVHGSVIGVIEAHRPAHAPGWTSEQVSLLETLSEQVGMALESARTYQEAQRRAAEDRLLGEITAHMRETLDIDTVLRTAVREIGTAMGIPRIEVRLGKGIAQPAPDYPAGQVQHAATDQGQTLAGTQVGPPTEKTPARTPAGPRKEKVDAGQD
jgi:GAF domain-containing protein/HAMP domain-containing protein